MTQVESLAGKPDHAECPREICCQNRSKFSFPSAKGAVAILLFVVAFAQATARADRYYVDPRNGDDSFDGSQPTPEGGDSKVGPRKTLVGVMALTKANNGDVVYAAPGEYDEKNSSDNYRVKIPAGTSLIAIGRADETFIVGAPATGVKTDESPFGCGSDAIRCVNMAANSKLIGFTVCGGRGPGTSTSSYCGGVYAANSNDVVVVDCIISNNVSGRAGGMYYGIAVRCEFTHNRAVQTGSHVMRSSLYNSHLHDALGGDSKYPAYQSTMRNCHLSGGANTCIAFNSYVSSDRSANKFYFSRYSSVSSGSTSTAVTNSSVVAAASMQLDENRRPLMGSHSGIDKGCYYYYTNGMPTVVADMLGVDFKKGQRVHNGEIDICCGEYDSRADLAYSLTRSDCFSVDQESSGVESAFAGSVTIPGGEEMSAMWAPPEGAPASTGYGFKATVAGDAVLHVYRDGREVACWTAADGPQALGYVAGGHSLRFVCEGEGVATLSGLKSMFGHAWYVNVGTGDDAFDGTAPVPEGGTSTVGPKKTLAGAMAISGLASGDVVHVAAGTYDEGEMAPVSGAVCGITTNRVVVKAGVGLVADAGPDATFIVGRKPTGGGATGPDAMRCVYLNSGSWLYGFTLTNGATCANGSYGDYGGGVSAASGACSANCRFTCNSARRGGAAYGGWYVGCRFGTGNTGNENSGIYDCQGVFNSDFDTCKPYGKWTLVNCTFRNCSPQGNGAQNLYNCFIVSDSGKNCNYYNCILTGRNAEATSVPYGNTRFNVDDAGFDAETIRPTADSSLVNTGVKSDYDGNFPADWVMFKPFDLCGGQRVYHGGQIDVGAGEFDWRAAFAKALHPSRASVTAATEGVALSGGDVVLGDGDSLTVDWTVPSDGKTEIKASLSGEGAAVVLLDGEPLELGSSGVTCFDTASGVHRMEFAFAGGGALSVSAIRRMVGSIVIIN